MRVCPRGGVSCSPRLEGRRDTGWRVDGPGEHGARWSEPVSKAQVWDSIYVRFLESSGSQGQSVGWGVPGVTGGGGELVFNGTECHFGTVTEFCRSVTTT